MTTIFSESYEKLSKFIFNLYDFENKGKISKEDVKVILSYMPLKIRKFSSKKLKFEKEEFKDRVESQDELHSLIEHCFGKRDKLDESEFLEVIENVSSDIFLFILIFLFEKKPFSKGTININEGRKLNTSLIKINRTPVLTSKYIASPNLHSKFSPSLAIKRSPMMTKRLLLDQYSKKDNGSPFKTESKNLLMKFATKSKPSKTNTFLSRSKNEFISKKETFDGEFDDTDEKVDLIAIPVYKKKRNDLYNLGVFGTPSYKQYDISTKSSDNIPEENKKEIK